MFISQDNKQAMRNPWVLGWLGLLAFVLLVNVVFIVTAFNTSPGLVEEGYYEKGRDHEENFQKRMEARNRLGWEMNLHTPEEILVNQPRTYSLNIVDKAGLPLKDAEVTFQAYRPSDSAADFAGEMEMLSTGVYQSRLDFSLKGIWDLKVMVRQGDDELEVSRRINVLAQ